MLSYRYKKSILSFLTSYIYTPSVSIYNYIFSFYNYNNSEEKIKVDIDSKTIELSFSFKEYDYKIKTNLVNNNLKEIYEKIQSDFKNYSYNEKTYLSAVINNEYDITDLINQYCGPFGDFYQKYGLDMKVSFIIPDNLKKNFISLKLIDNEAELYEFTDINSILKTSYNLYWFNNFNKYEQNKIIMKCPYI